MCCVSSFLETAVQESCCQANSQACTKTLATYKFLATTQFICDSVGAIALLCKLVQHDGQQNYILRNYLKTTKEALMALRETDGHSLKSFKAEIPQH